MAAEVEERIVGTDPVAAEQLGEQVGDAPLGALGGFAVLGAGTGPGSMSGSRQRGTVDLAVRGDRDLLEHNVCRRRHVLRQRRGDPGADAFDVDVLGVPVGRA